MRVRRGRALFAVCLLATISIISVQAQQSGTVKRDDVVVLEFKDAEYPSAPRFLHISGAVVVQAKLNDQGMVTGVVVLSGEPRLAPAAADNVKTWRFRPNASKSAVIVYNFVYLEGRCQSNGSFFVLAPSNLATVYGCGAPPMAAP